jgi:putative effector of murein hydrolase LrgA (UPF0299 family)
MIFGVTLLLAAQLAGEIIVRALHLPAPGPVIGLLIVVAGGLFYLNRPGARDLDDLALSKVASALTANMGVLFVPAGVGIVKTIGTIGANALAISVALVASLLITLCVTVATFLLVKKWRGPA